MVNTETKEKMKNTGINTGILQMQNFFFNNFSEFSWSILWFYGHVGKNLDFSRLFLIKSKFLNLFYFFFCELFFKIYWQLINFFNFSDFFNIFSNFFWPNKLISCLFLIYFTYYFHNFADHVKKNWLWFFSYFFLTK